MDVVENEVVHTFVQDMKQYWPMMYVNFGPLRNLLYFLMFAMCMMPMQCTLYHVCRVRVFAILK